MISEHRVLDRLHKVGIFRVSLCRGSVYDDGWAQARKCKAKEGSISFPTYFWRPHSFIHCDGFIPLVDTDG